MSDTGADLLRRWQRRLSVDRDFDLLHGPAAITYAEHYGLRVNCAADASGSAAYGLTPAEARQHVERTGDPSPIWLRVVPVDAELQLLRTEAEERGDPQQQFIARMALSGNVEAYQMCTAIIADRWRREWIRMPGASRTKELI